MKILDTNIFIHCNYEQLMPFATTTGVLAELDILKDGEHKRAVRKALNFILDKKIQIIKDSRKETVDDALILAAKNMQATLYTNDVTVQIKAFNAKVPCITIPITVEEYNGLQIVTDAEFGAEVLNGSCLNKYNMYENEYIQIKDEYGKEIGTFKYCREQYFKLKNNGCVSPRNIEQRCAIDLLCDNNIPIKIILGTFGSAKTFLSTTIGYHKTAKQGEFSKMVFVRNADSGSSADEQLGFLPGDYVDKMMPLLAPFAQYLPRGQQDIEAGLLNGTMEAFVTSNIKGISLTDSFIIVDEAEDFTMSQLRRVGSRIGENSVMVFTGDSKQTEGHFIQTSGLEAMVDELKGNPLVGIIRLKTDERSAASKIFAGL